MEKQIDKKAPKFFELANSIAILITIIVACFSLAWFFFDLSGRVSTLERQLQAIYQSELTASESSQNPESVENESPNDLAAAKPKLTALENTCVDLAQRAAKAHEEGWSNSIAQPLEELMENVGCYKLIN